MLRSIINGLVDDNNDVVMINTDNGKAEDGQVDNFCYVTHHVCMYSPSLALKSTQVHIHITPKGIWKHDETCT